MQTDITTLFHQPLIALISIVLLVLIAAPFLILGRKSVWAIATGVLVLAAAVYIGYLAFFSMPT